MHKIKNANEIDPKAQPIDRVAARVVYGEAVHFNEKRRQELKIEEGGLFFGDSPRTTNEFVFSCFI